MEDDQEYKKLPVEDRCVHKLWKARVDGYEEVRKLFQQLDDEKAPEFGKYLGLVKKFVTDSNAMGQEKGLEATLAYVENYAYAHKTVSEVMSGVVAKCIAASRTRTRDLALQLTLMYVEIERQEQVLDELMKGTEQKNPKVTAACISATTTALRDFGAKVINVKPLVKKIPTLFADRDKGVRDEARQLVVEMYRWIGGALRPQLSSLQPVQVTELEGEFGKIDGQKAVPTRFVRSQQQKQIVAAAETKDADVDECDEGEEEDEAQPQIDPYDLADPVDILSKLPKDFYEKVEAKKWQDRKEAIDTVENLLKTPKLQNGDYGDLVRVLKKIIEKDSNVVVVAAGGRCLASLASGLKKRFQTYAGVCVSPLLEKFKEKKSNVVSAIKDAIDAVYLTTTMEAILDDVLEALGNKNPSVKAETSFFLARAFARTQPSVFNKKLLKAMTTALLKIINEPDPTVRDASAEAIGTLMKLVGNKAIAPFLVELERDQIKMAKINECYEKAELQVKVAGVKKERPKTAPVVKPRIVKAAPAPVAKSAPARVKPDISCGSATVVRQKAKPSSKTVVKQMEREISDEEAEEVAANILSGSVSKELVDSNWKTRLSAVEQFLKDVQALDSKDIPSQALVRVLSRKPGLKDTNFQVLKAKLEAVKYIAENSTFSITTVNNCINEITEKFGDAKNGSLVGETISAMADATTFKDVSILVIDFAINQKNPKVLQESLTWLTNGIKEFGFPGAHTKAIIENTKKALASTNPSVRQTAITLCGVLFLYVGPPIYSFFETEKPSLKDQIHAECDKYENEKPPAPSRGISKSQSANSVNDLDSEHAGGGGEPEPIPNLSDLLPRVDISAQITEALINDMNDKNWKVRNEALGKVNSMLQDAKLIKSPLGDLPPALAKRLSDSNVKIAQAALNICEQIAKTMGPPCKQYVKVFFPCILQNLGDTKSWMRAAAREALDAFAKEAAFKEFFENEMVADALKSGSPQMRIELWAWLSEHLPKAPPKAIAKEELLACVPHLYSNLEDRNADVRKNAQEATLGIMMHLGYEAMQRQTEKLKPGSKNVIVAVLEKVRPNLPVKPLPKKAAVPEREEKTVRGTAKAPSNRTMVKPKGSAASVKTNASASSRKKEEDVDTSDLLAANNLKNQRSIDEAKLKVLKWNFTSPRDEFVDLLKDQMYTANVNKTLQTNMFHVDFRYHIKALEMLTEDLQNNGPALVANLDLILKWLTLRFFDTNPSVLLKGLEYLTLVFNMLIETKYRMLENEASSFFPYLIIKIGDPKDSVRNGVRSLFKQIPNVYPVSRLINYIMEGLKSKNARQRAECLEAMEAFIADYGLSIFTPTPNVCLKEIAKQISDRDNSVRNAALNCVVQGYFIVGDKIYKMLGTVSDKDMSLLEERIKRSSRRNVMPKAPEPKPIASPQRCEEAEPEPEPDDECEPEKDEEEEPLPPVVVPVAPVQKEVRGPFRLDPKLMNELDQMATKPPTWQVQEFDLAFLNEAVNLPCLAEKDGKVKIEPLIPPKPVVIKTEIAVDSGPSKPNRLFEEPLVISAIIQIASYDFGTVIEGFDQLTAILQSPKAAQLADYENEFFKALVTKLRHLRAADPRFDHDSVRIYRQTLSIIDLFYQTKELGRNLQVESIKGIVDELLRVLVAGKIDSCQGGDAYVRVINLQCVKIIENSDHSRIICALVNLMQECIREDNSPRRTDLVMKCLWRVIKIMPTWGDVLEYDSILLDVHLFLKEFPPVWWRTKPTDTSLRTIKTILHTCVKIKGGTIMCHLGKIPNTSESDIEGYLLKILKQMNLEMLKEVPAKPEMARVALSRSIHNRLTEIFQKIGVKDETKEGLNLLYDFIQQHPEADIEPFLKKRSAFFQEYIHKGLRDVEEARKESKCPIGKKVTITPNQSSLDSKGPDYWRQRLNMHQNSLDVMYDT